MTKIKNLIIGVFAASTLFLVSCGNDDKQENANTISKQEQLYNMLTTVESPSVLTSVNLMQLLEKSNILESKEVPQQMKGIVNGQIKQHLNSEQQGFKLEGNIPFIVSNKENGDFGYMVSAFEVLDAKKIGPSLCMYFGGNVVTENEISILKIQIPQTEQSGAFVWDNDFLVFVYSNESHSEQVGLNLLKAKNTSATDNKVFKEFLNKKDDIASTFIMKNYIKASNKISETTMDDELLAVYDDMIVSTASNFNPGEFIFEYDVDGQKYLDSKFNPIGNHPIDASFNDFISEDGKLIFFASSVLNMDAIVNSMEQTHTNSSEWESEVKKLGVTPKDLSSAFDGNFMLSLLNIEMLEDAGEEIPRVLFSCGIKDETILHQLLTNNPEVGKINNYYKTEETFVAIANQKLFVSLSEDLIAKLANGEKLTSFSTNINSPLYGELITDMNQLPDYYKNALLKDGGEEILKLYNEVKAVKFNGTAQHGTLDVKLNKEGNSFELLMNTIIKTTLPLIMQGMM